MADGLRRRGVGARASEDRTPLSTLQAFDVLQKVDEDLVESSRSGGAVTLVTAIVIAFLVCCEVHEFSRVEVVEHIEVDTRTTHKLPISLNISFPNLRCTDFNVEVVDRAGASQDDLGGRMKKISVDHLGRPKDPAPGCQVHGDIEVKRLQGNIHLTPGAGEFQLQTYNTSHIIHDVSFGQELPEWVSPLDGVTKEANKGGVTFHYRLHLVPTIVTDIWGNDISSYQYSMTEEEKGMMLQPDGSFRGLPGVFIFYDFGAFVMHKYEKKKPLSYLLTSLCALVGGAFSIATLVELVFSTVGR